MTGSWEYKLVNNRGLSTLVISMIASHIYVYIRISHRCRHKILPTLLGFLRLGCFMKRFNLKQFRNSIWTFNFLYVWKHLAENKIREARCRFISEISRLSVSSAGQTLPGYLGQGGAGVRQPDNQEGDYLKDIRRIKIRDIRTKCKVKPRRSVSAHHDGHHHCDLLVPLQPRPHRQAEQVGGARGPHQPRLQADSGHLTATPSSPPVITLPSGQLFQFNNLYQPPNLSNHWNHFFTIIGLVFLNEP